MFRMVVATLIFALSSGSVAQAQSDCRGPDQGADAGRLLEDEARGVPSLQAVVNEGRSREL